MLSLKTPLAIIIAVVCAVIAYFVAASSAQSSIAIYLPSIFSIVSVVALLVVSSIINNNAQQAPASDKPQASKSSPEGLSTLYIGNLAYKANESIVHEHFANVGEIKSVRLVKDKKTGRRKGFGFVEINTKDESKFIKTLNETDFMERSIIVRPANDKKH